MSTLEDVTNSDRADFAAEALNVFCVRTYGGQSFDELIAEAHEAKSFEESDAGTAIFDLICDLMHLARRHGIDPHECVNSGISTFQTEEAEEDERHNTSGHDDAWHGREDDDGPWDDNPADKNRNDERDEDVPIENEVTRTLLRLRYIKATAAFDDYMERENINARRACWLPFQDMVESAVCLVDQNRSFTHNFEVEFKPGTTDIVHIQLVYDQPF